MERVRPSRRRFGKGWAGDPPRRRLGNPAGSTAPRPSLCHFPGAGRALRPRWAGGRNGSRGHHMRAMLAKRVYWLRKAKWHTPVGPFRCLETMISAVPRSADSGL